jgi:hypothetical protein
MSSVPTQKELKELFQNNKCFPVDYKGCVVMTDEALREKGGDSLLKWRDLVWNSSCMCVTSTNGDGTVSREQVRAIYYMALPLLTQTQKSNLDNWMDTRGSTVATYTYQQLQWLHRNIKKEWKTLPPLPPPNKLFVASPN